MTESKNNLPPILYKYRSLNGNSQERTLDIIQNCRLYWPSPIDFNDPFDCRPLHIYEGTPSQHKLNAKRAANYFGDGKNRPDRRRQTKENRKLSPDDIVRSLDKSNEHLLSKMGVCSLAERPDSLLMWSHYADSHKGICLGFEPSIDAIDFACAFPVKYSTSRPVLNAIRPFDANENAEKSVLTKYEGWSYERERRMIDQKISERKKPFPPSALIQIIFGTQCSQDVYELVAQAVYQSECKPKFFQAKQSKEEYSLVFHELTPAGEE